MCSIYILGVAVCVGVCESMLCASGRRTSGQASGRAVRAHECVHVCVQACRLVCGQQAVRRAFGLADVLVCVWLGETVLSLYCFCATMYCALRSSCVTINLTC